MAEKLSLFFIFNKGMRRTGEDICSGAGQKLAETGDGCDAVSTAVKTASFQLTPHNAQETPEEREGGLLCVKTDFF